LGQWEDLREVVSTVAEVSVAVVIDAVVAPQVVDRVIPVVEEAKQIRPSKPMTLPAGFSRSIKTTTVKSRRTNCRNECNESWITSMPIPMAFLINPNWTNCGLLQVGRHQVLRTNEAEVVADRTVDLAEKQGVAVLAAVVLRGAVEAQVVVPVEAPTR
jgi:hypothetical protein